jgi:hypothetical protein
LKALECEEKMAAEAPIYNVRDVLTQGLAALRVTIGRKETARQVKIFEKHYGIHPYHVARIWRDFTLTDIAEAKLNPKKEKLKHFFIALYFLRCYNEETQNATTFDCDPDTCRKWQWVFVRKLAAMKRAKIMWPADNFNDAIFIVSVDGTHCPVNEPIHPTKRKHPEWFSKKENGPALNYELAIDLWQDRVVWSWCSGGAGKYNDIKTFQMHLKQRIPYGKRIICDLGYRGAEVAEGMITMANSLDSDVVRRFKSRARSRHENFNGRLKRFKCLFEQFRHGIHNGLHNLCFDAVLVICQYEMEGPIQYCSPLHHSLV